MTDEELLRLVGAERKASIGFDNDATLTSDREAALNYFKGEMPDLKVLPNRSKAISTDVADAVYTALPDLVEIFTAGDDVVTFRPNGEEDEDAAAQETDYVQHVVFAENPGFMVLTEAFQDALLSKTGVFKWVWEKEQYEDEKFQGKTAAEVQMAAQYGEIIDLAADGVAAVAEPEAEAPHAALEGPAEAADPAMAPAAPEAAPAPVQMAAEPMPEETFSFTLRRTAKAGCVKVMSVPPEDFTVAPDTVVLRDTTYCAMRSRPRAQQLVADGYDADLVSELPGAPRTTEIEGAARDTVDEGTQPRDAMDDRLRSVEIVEHFIRLEDGGKLKLWRVVTGKDEGVLLLKEEVEEIQFSAITPYLVTHRFYGRSVADLLLEIQRIKTALLRMWLDSGYFALNQRNEVNMKNVNEFTVSDLLRNEPGVPVRSNGDAIKPIQAGGLPFDVAGAMEHVSVMSEQRTGIVRNAQGLNPDTLHDTARGAEILMSKAQKRLRMIARIFAETGVKDMFLGVHAMIRRHATQAATVRLRNKWVDVDPTAWGARQDMTIDLGVGSGGREHDLAAGQQLLNLMEKAGGAQGGLNGPLMTVSGLYAALKRQTERLGFKNAETYWRDPATYEAPAAQPTPEMLKIKAESEAKAAELAQKGAIEQARLDQEGQLKRDQMVGEFQLERERMTAEFALKNRQAELDALVRQTAPPAAGMGRPVELGGAAG